MRKIQDTTTRVVRFELEDIEQETRPGVNGRPFRLDHLLLEYATRGGVGPLRLARVSIDGPEVLPDGRLDPRRYRGVWSWSDDRPWPPRDAPRVAVEAVVTLDDALVDAGQLAAIRRARPLPESRPVETLAPLDNYDRDPIGGPE